MIRIYRKPLGLVRVAVMVAGDYRQRYFHLDGSRAGRARILRQARALERRWLADQAAAARNRVHRARPTSRARWPHRTGVRGILLQPGRFEIAAAGVATSVAIAPRGLGPAWRAAVKLLAAARGIRDYSHWLRRQPRAKQLRALARKRA
jgi:hypothetical protein